MIAFEDLRMIVFGVQLRAFFEFVHCFERLEMRTLCVSSRMTKRDNRNFVQTNLKLFFFRAGGEINLWEWIVLEEIRVV